MGHKWKIVEEGDEKYIACSKCNYSKEYILRTQKCPDICHGDNTEVAGVVE